MRSSTTYCLWVGAPRLVPRPSSYQSIHFCFQTYSSMYSLCIYSTKQGWVPFHKTSFASFYSFLDTRFFNSSPIHASSSSPLLSMMPWRPLDVRAALPWFSCSTRNPDNPSSLSLGIDTYFLQHLLSYVLFSSSPSNCPPPLLLFFLPFISLSQTKRGPPLPLHDIMVRVFFFFLCTPSIQEKKKVQTGKKTKEK